MRRSFRAPAGTQAAAGRPPQNDPLSTDIRRSPPLGGETTRRCSSRSDDRLRQGTNKEACPGAHLPTYPGGLKLTPPSISDPPRLNRTQTSKRNISPQRAICAAIELESADLKGMPTVRESAYYFLSISVARRSRSQTSKRNISPQRAICAAIELESADLKGMPTVRESAYYFLSISVARRFGEQMFSFLAHKSANGNFGASPTFYGPLQEARFNVVH